MASNSQAKWSIMIGWFSVGISRYGRLPWRRSVSVFFLSPGKFRLSETEKVFKKWNLIFSSQQSYYSKRNLAVNVKDYCSSKFADGRRRLRTFTKRRSVRSVKETMPYNKQLTNFTCSDPYWRILALGRLCAYLVAHGPYCHDLGPIFPSTAVALGQ